MKVFTVVGIHHSGKTTIVEKVTEGVKEKRVFSRFRKGKIHFEKFA